jgi:tRNA (guanine37-N1)-methyltransferase
MDCIYAIVPKEQAEEVRLRLMEEGILRTDVVIEREGDSVLLPVHRESQGLKHVEKEATPQLCRASDYRELVNVPEEMASLLPSSLDIIGGIAIIKVPEELLGHCGAIGAAIIAANSSIKSAYQDLGVSGKERIRELKWLSGERNTVTTHREFGIALTMDISKVYFSPRLATERDRVCQLVREGEAIIDMFAGVGPFSVMMAKNCRPRCVYSIDINPDAVRFLQENIALNKVEEVIKPILGDAAVEAPRLKADRIIMNLPHSSFDFFDAALSAANPKAIIHYYEILENTLLDERLAELVNKARARAIPIKIESTREVHTYSPSQKMYAIDTSVHINQ